VTFDMNHDDATAPSLVLCLVQVVVDPCSFHVRLGFPSAICNVGGVF
jgi:hypothetical protein